MNERLLWDVRTEAPALVTALDADVGLRSAYDVASALPSAPSADRFEQGALLRPPSHRRAFYVRLDGGGVVAVKGSEIACGDVGKVLSMLRGTRFLSNVHSLLEWYPLREQKVPMALLAREALDEARAAANVQSEHFARYGALARLPFPLRVEAWDRESTERFAELLLPLLSPRARETVETRLAAGGLARYAYHYPSLPVRVLDFVRAEGAPAESDYPAYAERLRRRVGDPTRIARSWIQLVARLLKLGFIPCDASTDGVGNCVRAQNVVLDGGLVDVDSLLPLSTFRNDGHLAEALLLSVAELAMTVGTFFTGGAVHRPGRGRLGLLDGDFFAISLTQPAVAAFVYRELELALFDEDGVADDRIATIVRAVFADPVRAIASMV
jgi:hypothetical protein